MPSPLTYLSLNLPHNDRILIPSQQVLEIISVTLSQMSPVPDVESPVMGVYPWRGEILWVMDGSALLGGSAIHEQRDRITLRYSVLIIQESGEHLGILVPSVGDLVRSEPSLETPIVDLHNTISLFRRQLQAGRN